MAGDDLRVAGRAEGASRKPVILTSPCGSGAPHGGTCFVEAPWLDNIKRTRSASGAGEQWPGSYCPDVLVRGTPLKRNAVVLRETPTCSSLSTRAPSEAMDKNEGTIFVVDDDSAMCESLGELLESVDAPVETFSSAREFLESYDPRRPGCLVLDLRMPGMSGLDVQEELATLNIELPIIFLTGFGEVPTAVRAMKNGAFDFIEKPVPSESLIDCVRKALESDRETRRRQARRSEVKARLVTLTPREREVLALVVAARSSKEIAAELGIATKTVEIHRGHIMQKMRAESVANLVSMVMATNTSTDRWPR